MPDLFGLHHMTSYNLEIYSDLAEILLKSVPVLLSSAKLAELGRVRRIPAGLWPVLQELGGGRGALESTENFDSSSCFMWGPPGQRYSHWMKMCKSIIKAQDAYLKVLKRELAVCCFSWLLCFLVFTNQSRMYHIWSTKAQHSVPGPNHTTLWIQLQTRKVILFEISTT